MNKPSEALIALSQKIGQRAPLWVQGNGGNISEKNASDLCIKASGVRLEHMEYPGNFAIVATSHQEALDNLLSKKKELNENVEACYFKWIQDASMKGENLGRASMETGFHLLLTKKFVLHFHSVASLLLSHELKKNMNILHEANTEGLNICLMNLLSPGLELTQALKEEKEHDAYLLDSHGVILQGEDDQILEQWNRLETRFLERQYPGLLVFYHKSENEVLRHLGRLKSPMRFYFPDTAVYYAELIEYIIPTGDGEFEITEPEKKILEYAVTKNWKKLNLLEIWAATVAINKYCPEFPEIPEALAASIANLPSEVFRKTRGN